MGHVLAQMIEEKDGFALAGMVDPLKGESLANLNDVDVVIDFSNPANLPMVMAYCEEHKCPKQRRSKRWVRKFRWCFPATTLSAST